MLNIGTPRWEGLRATLRARFKLHEKHRNQISNLIGEAVAAGRLKRKDTGSGNKFAEYLPYWA